jgi:hypothetical protein
MYYKGGLSHQVPFSTELKQCSMWHWIFLTTLVYFSFKNQSLWITKTFIEGGEAGVLGLCSYTMLGLLTA